MNLKALSISLAFVLALLAPECVDAQIQASSWSQLQVTISPPPRLRHVFAYDNEGQNAVLFGGTGVSDGSFVVLGDTWIWNSERRDWQGPLALIPTPGPRYGSAMVYDSYRRTMVLFGGSDQNNIPLSDTWEFNGAAWKQITPTISPADRSFHALSYDSVRQKVILFGGLNGSTLTQDTWSWDGVEWIKLADSGPPSRELHSLSYFPVQNKTFLFGGFKSTSYLNDTWQFDGANWTINNAAAPEARIESPFVFNPSLNQSILFGGLNQAGMPLGDTWSWNGTDWQLLLTAGPSSRRGAMTIYDSKLTGIILFGGSDNSGNIYGDTWLFSATDGDKDGVTDYLDQCPADPRKTIEGFCGCGISDSNLACALNIENIKPARPTLRMRKRKLRVQMEQYQGVDYQLVYYEEVRAKRKPKIVTKISKSAKVDINKLKLGSIYVFKYRLKNKSSSANQSKLSAAAKLRISIKR